MKLIGFVGTLALGTVTWALVWGQNFAAPPSKPPDDSTRKAIIEKTKQLGELVDAMRRNGGRDPQLADIEIFHKAAAWIVRQNEFYQPEAGAWTLAALEEGLRRAALAGKGEAPWLDRTGCTIVRGHRSRIDGSVQPFAVTYPADYGKDRTKSWRLDVVLHGRDPSLTEVKFLHEHGGEPPAPKLQRFVRLDIYGRGNNAYRWAGESDIIEVVDHLVATEHLLGREGLLDPTRVVLRGFSMGGAGTWHLGLHGPSRWCVLGPGAGFTTTHGFVKDLPEKLPPQQEACLHIYDAVDYAENALNVPVVAYAGDQDPQLQAARNIEARLKPLGIPMTLLVAPGLGHSFPPEWQEIVGDAYTKAVAKGRDPYPKHVHFVTYTLHYPSCAWVEILGLDRHYERALVDAEQTESGFTVKTANVRSLHLTLPVNPPRPFTVSINGQVLNPLLWLNRAGVYQLYLERAGETWTSVLPQKILVDRMRRPQKFAGVQGPIDDAFMDSFLCVRGTGTPWHEGTQKAVEASLQRYEAEWEKYMRGHLPVKRDDEVNEDDIVGRHLILFGDPSSNSLISQVLDGLPLKWTKEQITLGAKQYATAEHVPVLIYPSPLNASRYVVLNSGHTFHAADFEGNNALLYPRLGDYAILKVPSEGAEPGAAEVVTAGLFDDFWQIKPAGADKKE
jgi:dienelactone hydrolase